MSHLTKSLSFLSLLLVSGVVLAGPYPGKTQNHGHTTAAGDGGALSNPSITGGSISPSTVTASQVTASTITANSLLCVGKSSYTANQIDFSSATTPIKLAGVSVASVTTAGYFAPTKNPAFSVRRITSSIVDFAGAAVGARTVTFNSEDFDAGNWVVGSTFTAPVAGLYQFNVNVQLQNLLASAHTSAAVTLFTGSGGWSDTMNSVATVADTMSYTISALVSMTAGQQAYVTVTVTGGSQDIDLLVPSSFSGYLVEYE